ncbi:chloride channel protein [Mangrovicoccus algicola]|uniref:chloride channel protein n=1 Tax=Mangrovicoccus algicola TaxID=2771008 RepID=UPI001D021D01|nr:chloride channel protein [Mangrovicoccus algicola]
MAGQRGFLRDQLEEAGGACREGWQVLRRRGPDRVQFWFIALLVGIASGMVTLAFRKGIEQLQILVYTTHDVHLHSIAETLPWYWLLAVPVIGGLIVGQILHRFTPDGRVRSVADVIEGAALKEGRVEMREGLASAAASLVTLSTGGSTGREGPVVHLAGTISSWVSRRLRADGMTGRDLLGCAVAAAVSASFNAPIAGALFALEVVLRHFAVHAFAPIAIASVAGTVVNRLEYGNVTEFRLPEPGALNFYEELPAFLLLGLVCGLVAVVLMRSIFFAEEVAGRVQGATGMPRWLRPGVSGAMLGLMAIWFPHVIGVGYETTAAALTGQLTLGAAVVFALVKAAAVSVTFAGRMGGGVFSPSLMMGALTGLAFGHIATAVFPDISGSEGVYALAGTGAVAAAVLGAPISTTLIVFELTGDWQVGIAVMTSVSLSSALASRMVARSFFLTQLERRGISLADGPQRYILAMFRVSAVMRPIESPTAAPRAALEELLGAGIAIDQSETLHRAMPLFDQGDTAILPVIRADGAGEPEIVGALHHLDALKAYSRALAATAAEEHS